MRMIGNVILLATLTLSALLSGCVSAQQRAQRTAQRDVELTQGYSLLYSVCSQQSNVDTLLLVKSASDPTQQLIARIAEACGQAQRKLESFAQGDPRIGLDATDLPALEDATREAIESQTRNTLIFAGDDFELRLLLTQVEALNYVAHLADQLADRDKNETHADWLRQFAGAAGELHDEVIERLTVKS